MPQDALHIRKLTFELDPLLRGGKVNRISQTSKDEVTLIIYTVSGVLKLILSTNATYARVCISSEEKTPLPVAPNFCMLLRKHLLGGEILSVRQHDFDRIVEIRFQCESDFSSKERVLVAELMGKYSNLVLTEDGKILGALKTSSLEENKRLLFAGAPYAYPPLQDKLSPFDTEEVQNRLEGFLALHSGSAEELSSFLFENVAGLSFQTACVLSARLDKKNLPKDLADLCLSPPKDSFVLYENGEPKDFSCFSSDGAKRTEFLWQAEDEYYLYRENKKLFSEKRTSLLSRVNALKKKQTKSLQATLERLHEADNADTLKLYGELVTANIYLLERGDEILIAKNWYLSPPAPTRVPLDKTLTPSQNAQKYFKQYAKRKRAKEILLPRLEKEKEEESYTDSILSFLNRAENLTDLCEIEEELLSLGLCSVQSSPNKKKKTEMPFRTYTCSGFTVYAGRNNVQNDRLVKSASASDVWLHTQKYHSSHVIIRTEGKKVPNDVLLFAAEICAYYSDGKDGDKIPVDYCERRFVKKPSKCSAGFVTYTNYETLLVTPNKHA